MSDFDPIGVSDQSTEDVRLVGAVEDDDSVFHQTTAPVGVALTSEIVTITDTPTIIAVQPGVNWVIVDMGEEDWNAGFVDLFFAGSYSPGGTPHAVPVFNMTPAGPLMAGYPGASFAPNTTQLFFELAESLHDGSSVYMIPAFGLSSVYIFSSGPSKSGVIVSQHVGYSPLVTDMTPRGPRRTGAMGDATYDSSPYAVGEVIGGSFPMIAMGYQPNTMFSQSAPLYIDFLVMDSHAELTDFDIVVSAPDSLGLADHDPLEASSIFDLIGIIEVRASPTGRQYQTYEFAVDSKGACVNNNPMRGAYVQNSGAPGGSLWVADLQIVARAATTFGASGSIDARITLEI